ncbi:hypothetical protein OK016_01400 [Vibrio chagasii]|nr:hypothetical protein [Vibrio chagasii]
MVAIQSTAFIVDGIPAGTVSLDLTVFSEEDRDYMEIYINGFEVGAFCGAYCLALLNCQWRELKTIAS